MKKLLLFITLTISTMGLFAQSVGDEIAISYGNYYLKFSITNNSPAECYVSGFSGEPVNVTIPSTVTISGKEYSVTSIGNSAFSGCSSLTSIEIPNSVTYIENWAFKYCSSLTSIEIPNSVTSIESYVFNNCSSLTSIEIPNTITSIGYDNFSGCSSITRIIVESGNTFYDSRNDCNAIIKTNSNELIVGCQNTIIPSSVTSIGNYAFSGQSSLTYIEIPNTITSIGYYAFNGCKSLTSIKIPNSITSIKGSAFSGCSSLTSLEIPNSVISIGSSAFSGCSSLTSIEIPNSVTYIESYVFNNCSSLKSIEIPNSVTSIGGRAFKDCSSLTSIEIPNSVTSIGDYAFDNCSSLTSIEIPNSVISIGISAFSSSSNLASIIVESGNIFYDSRNDCNAIIETISNKLIVGCQNTIIPNSVTSIGGGAFENCSSLTSIKIPNSITSIKGSAFYNCSSLTSIEFEDDSQLVSIEYSAFGFSPLTSIEIPNTVTSIGDYVFQYSKLTKIYCHAESVPDTKSNAFRYSPSKMVIYVPEKSVDLYKAASPWNNYTIKAIPTHYNVTVVLSPENAGIITGAGAYSIKETEEVTLTATPNEGYKFVNWTENGVVVSSDAQYTFVATSDRDLVANFALLKYDITASVNIEEAGAVYGSGVYNHGGNVTLTATAAEGYRFLNWTENGVVVSSDAQYTFVATRDRELVANYVLLEYNISTTVEPGIAGIVTGEGIHHHGDNVILTAISAEGYKFVNWTENGEVVSEDAQYTFVATRDRELVANYVEKEEIYNVILFTFNFEAGSMSGFGSYLEGEIVTVIATPNTGYEFAGWIENGSVVSEDAEYTFEITKDRILYANFIQIKMAYNITTMVNPEKVGVVIGNDIYYQDVEVTLTAIPIKNGYEFVNWTENDSIVSEDAQYTFVATRDRELVANFVLLEYYVSAVVNSAEAGEVTGDGNYNHGEDVTLTAIANEGYKFVNWTENGEVISSLAEYSFVIIKDRSLVANFEKLEDPENPENPGESLEELSSSISVYPNPANDRLYIETQTLTQTLTIEIYDVYGRHQVTETPSRQDGLSIDVSNLTSGVYFVKIATENGTFVKRIVKD